MTCACLAQRFNRLCAFRSSSLTEMEKWMEDIKMAIEMAKTSNGPSCDLLTSILTDNSKLLHEHGAGCERFTHVCPTKCGKKKKETADKR